MCDKKFETENNTEAHCLKCQKLARNGLQLCDNKLCNPDKPFITAEKFKADLDNLIINKFNGDTSKIKVLYLFREGDNMTYKDKPIDSEATLICRELTNNKINFDKQLPLSNNPKIQRNC